MQLRIYMSCDGKNFEMKKNQLAGGSWELS